MRCKACNCEVQFGAEFCQECYAIATEYNQDVVDNDAGEMGVFIPKDEEKD